jgi:hypothetical protein
MAQCASPSVSKTGATIWPISNRPWPGSSPLERQSQGNSRNRPSDSNHLQTSYPETH